MNELLALLLPSNEAKMNPTADHHSFLNGHSSALEQAKGIQANSSGQFPSFLKQLLKSHLSGKFYLGLPKKFCDAHMPSHDDTIVLVDDNEQEYNTKYSVRKNRLSGGWRGFSIAHELLEGDALVFHLIEPCKFRVYIMKAGKITDNDASIGVHTDFPNIKPISAVKMEDQTEEESARNAETTQRTYLNSLSFDSHHHQETKKARLISDDIDHFGCNVLEGNSYFEDVKGFEDFKILLDGQILDSEVSTNLRTKYYNLCCSQKMFLHKCLIKGLSSKLTIAMIYETVKIADAVHSSDLGTSSIHCMECWGKTLKAFEELGMAVGFLRDRIQKLVSLSREYQVSVETFRSKQAQGDEEISNQVGCVEAEVETLKWTNKNLGFEFEMLARAPW